MLEHVEQPDAEPSLKDEYRCSNKNCVSHKQEMCWNDGGELYCSGFPEKTLFISENDAPFGTFERKLNVEIRKQGVKDEIELPMWLLLGFLRPVIEFTYKADENGKILSRWFKIKYWTKDGIGYSPATKIWKYLIWQFKMDMKSYRNNPSHYKLKQIFERSANTSWPYRWFHSIVEFVYSDLYKKYLIDEPISKRTAW